MRIFKVEVENYRQYGGKNTIEMSIDPNKHFTIIHGITGAGKSNFMNMVTWCFYGDEIHADDKFRRDVINESAIKNSKENDPITVQVTIEMGDTEPEYQIKRYIKYIKNRGTASEINRDFKIFQLSESKGYVPIEHVDWFIEKKIIPKSLRGFFFFDGEQLNLYFKDTKEVKKKVEDIAQIDVIASAISNLDAVRKTYNKELSKYSPKYANLNELESTNIEKRKEFIQKDEELRKEIRDLESEKENIDKFLTNNSDIDVSNLGRKRKELEYSHNESKKRIDEIISARKDILTSSLTSVFSMNALQKSREIIEKETQRGVLPPDIKDVFLMEILDRGTCICGQKLDEGDCRITIEKLLESIMPSNIADDTVNGKFILSALINGVDFRSRYSHSITEERRERDNIKKIAQELESINITLANHNTNEISEKSDRRKEIDSKIKQLNFRRGAYTSDVSKLDDEIALIRMEINNEKQNKQGHEHFSSLVETTQKLKELLESVKKDIVELIRNELERKTQQYFFEMIWKKDAFSRVCIIDSGNTYRISVISPEGAECAGDLSDGEKQTLAYSFTAALYSVSGYNVPVIIDTPLGRISNKPSEYIAEALTKYLPDTQIIMLVTDKEYSKPVREKLSVAVGNEYNLDYNEVEKSSKVVKYVC